MTELSSAFLVQFDHAESATNYNPPGVHHEVTITTPWDVIVLNALHEANRAGVEVLLLRARELGPTHLSPADRELLDRMATAARLTAERART